MTSTQDQLCLFRSATGRYQAAVTTKVVSGDTCHLLVLGDGSDWEDMVPAAYYARPMFSVPKGTGVGEWQPIDPTAEITSAVETIVASVLSTGGYLDGAGVTDAISTAIAGLVSSSAMTSAIASAVSGLASSSSVSSAIASAVSGLASTSAVSSAIAAAIAAIPPFDDSGLEVVAVAGTSHSGLGLNAVRQPSTTRPTKLNITGAFDMTSTVLGPQTASVDLLSDSSNPPTTRRGRQRGALSGVGAHAIVPWHLNYEVPPGDYYKLASSASANSTVDLDDLNETPA